MDMHPYRSPYTKNQMAKWRVLLDTANAIEFGFARYRFAPPGELVSVKKATGDVERMQLEWSKEWTTRDRQHKYTGTPAFSGMPIDAQLYMHATIKKLRMRREDF